MHVPDGVRWRGVLSGREARKQAVHVAVAAALLFVTHVAAMAGAVFAQQAAYARGRVESAQDLARRSLDCLRRGEDGATKEERLAAYREGLQLAERAIAADDQNADAHFARFANRGRIMLLEGAAANPFNLLTVNRELDRALELDPNHTDALAAKGGMYRQLPWLLGGSLDKAADCLTRAVSLDPTAVGARIELAETYRDMGHPERGIPLLQKAGELAERMGKQRQLDDARRLLRQFGAQP